MNEVVELSEQQLRPRSNVNWSTGGPTSMGELAASIAHEINQPLAGSLQTENLTQKYTLVKG
jgi:C4-dicarboxylate-specific signal transduction histidine kinase